MDTSMKNRKIDFSRGIQSNKTKNIIDDDKLIVFKEPREYLGEKIYSIF